MGSGGVLDCDEQSVWELYYMWLSYLFEMSVSCRLQGIQKHVASSSSL